MIVFHSLKVQLLYATFFIGISNAIKPGPSLYERHTSTKEKISQSHLNGKHDSPIHKNTHQHRPCNLTTAVTTTYYAKFNYSGPIEEGLTCYTVYSCDGNFQSTSPTCDSFVYYLLYMEAYELSVRAQVNSNSGPSPPDAIWTPDSGIFNYKEMIFRRDGLVTIKQRQRLKLFSKMTKDQLIDTDYATLNREYPREELRKWSKSIYIYNKTEYDINGNECTERKQCFKDNETWKCDTCENPNQEIVNRIPWHMKYFDALSGFLRIQFFLENNKINRTGYHGMDGDGWNVTDTVITGLMAGPNWQNETVQRVLFFDKLWVDGCRCQNKLQPGEDMVSKCEHWELMKRNFYIPFKPAGLNVCPNMDKLNIPSDAFESVS